jgi:hypothetical protein
MARNYRTIYEQHCGPIGKDITGRALEVHHIDGNHNNCDITNLKLVTIEEHYTIHKAQGDYAACAIMSYRMGLSPEETAELSRKVQKARIEAGTHNLLGPSHNQALINAGTHVFLDKEAARQRNIKRVKAGIHNLLKQEDGSSQSGDRVKAGTHHFITNNPVNNLLASGNHASKIKLSCRFCHKTTSKNQFTKLHSTCQEILPVIA